MRHHTEQIHYELLEIPVDASPFEIRKAYQELFELYRDDSIAAYSFFSAAERMVIISALERAYLTLIDVAARRNYDDHLIERGLMEEGKRYQDRSKEPVPMYNLRRSPYAETMGPAIPSSVKKADTGDSPVATVFDKDILTGADLKKIRIEAGITLEQISLQSKFKIGLFQSLEEDRFELLPPLAYLKGILKSYANCLDIEADHVVQSYIRHMESSKGK